MICGKKQVFLPPKFCILTTYSGNMDPGLPLKTVSNTFTYGLSKKPSLKRNGFTDFSEMSFEVGKIGQVQDRSVI
jgi:hypothetical protein